jgi:aerobic-type carbon monoxide dehydrogenase small subunit (CoxS/CutS family)
MEHETSVAFVLNGVETSFTGDAAAPVSSALREHGVFSVRETCGIGVCGTCTILLDGQPVSSCILPLYALDGRGVGTAEGLEHDGVLSDLQQAFIDRQAFQCSYCTPGFLMSAHALLESSDGPLTDEAIEAALQGHLCRCGCYATIKEAVRACADGAARVTEP